MVKRRFSLLAAALSCALGGWLLTLPQPPVYRARTSLDIQNLNENFMNMRAVDPTGTAGGNSAESYLQTQIKLLQSDSVVLRTIRKMISTDGNPQIPRQDLLSQWRRKIGFPARPDTVSREAMLQEIARNVKVRPMGLTRLVEITCDSPVDSLSTDFCNTMSNEFIAQSIEVRWDTAQKTSEWLARQLADVRTKLEQAEQRLQAEARAGSFYFDQDKDSTAHEKLRQVQAELSRAQAERIAREAQNGLLTSANPDSLPMVLDNGPLKEYQIKLTALQQELADLRSTYTPDHPKIVRLSAQIKQLENSMVRERENVIGRMRNEYATSIQREQMLNAAYIKQEKIVTAAVATTAQYNMLRREVESGRQLYETLLQRSKEAGFASALRSSTIRVVDPAQIPELPVAPKRKQTVGLGLLFGTLLGGAFAYYRERSDRFLRVPSDTRMHLHARELGVIPPARVSNRLLGGGSDLLRTKSAIEGGPDVLDEPRKQALELVTWQRKPSLLAESYRMVMSSILFAGGGIVGAPVIVVSSPSVGEGKTTVVSNIGIALAETKRRVVLVDGDMRRPRLHTVFGGSNEHGLANFLSGEIDAASCPLQVLANKTFIPGLSVMYSGQCEDRIGSLLHSRYVISLLARLKKEFDIVLIDSPPLLHVADARMLGHTADGVVLVVRAGITTRDTVLEAQHLLGVDGTPVLGTVLNDFDSSKDAFGYRPVNYYSNS